MKKIIALILCMSLMISGCSTAQNNIQEISDTVVNETEAILNEAEYIETLNFKTLDDENLLSYVEDSVYQELVTELDSDEYFVENVSAIYISNEYLEEISYNSQENIFFGLTLSELNEQFQGTKYVFTLGDDGQTVVKEFEEVTDENVYKQILKNVAIGAGVILVCVTVSAVTAGTAAPVVSMVFAASAKTGAVMALSSGGIGAVSAGVNEGIQTGDFGKAMEAAALAGSEGFKWGAITGAVSGGGSASVKYAKNLKVLEGVPLKGLSKKEAALIQTKSKYPVDVIKQYTKKEQYDICEKVGLKPKMVDGKTALVRKIDLNYVDDMGRTNLERMSQGLAALDDTGMPYELHHIGQKSDSTLAILTKEEHMKDGNNKIWHELGKETEVHGSGNKWDTQRQKFWKDLARQMGG